LALNSPRFPDARRAIRDPFFGVLRLLDLWVPARRIAMRCLAGKRYGAFEKDAGLKTRAP